MHRLVVLLAVLALAACDKHADDHGHDHGESGHDDHDEHGHDDPDDHDAHDKNDEHGHDHGGERVGWTSFSKTGQLFAEYTPPHAGEMMEFRIHLTELEGWKPVAGKEVRVTLDGPGGSANVLSTEIAPGIFETRLKPPAKGDANLKVIVGGGADVHFRAVSVSGESDHDEAHEGHNADGAHDHDDEKVIPFTLEQQWSIRFGLKPVVQAPVRPTFDAFGTLEPRLGGEGIVHAGARGRISGDAIPTLGQAVKQGDTLAWLTPSVAEQGDFASLDLAVRQATTRLRAAKVQRDRLSKLVKDGVIPQRRLVDANFAVEEAESNLSAARSRISQARGVTGTGKRPAGSIALKAPIDGVVVGVDVPPGLIVESGRPLFRIVDPDPIWLRVDVPEIHVARLDKVNGVWFTVAGFESPFELYDVPVAVGGTVDPRSRTLPVIVEVPNPGGRLRPGMFADVHVVRGEAVEATAIPEGAIVYEEGVPVAYAMVDAETFERRPLRLGERSAGFVSVERGLEAGEWVVTDGAFAVRLAALGDNASTGHGHAH